VALLQLGKQMLRWVREEIAQLIFGGQIGLERAEVGQVADCNSGHCKRMTTDANR
jgi:hypothetical protein